MKQLFPSRRNYLPVTTTRLITGLACLSPENLWDAEVVIDHNKAFI